MRFIWYLSLERMGAVGADRELDLEESLVGGDSAGVSATTQLPTNLRELAWPERDRRGLAGVALHLVIRVIGGLDARPDEPALGELILAREEPSASGLF